MSAAMTLDADGYHALLSTEEQAVVTEWIDREVPGRLVVRVDLLAEGDLRMMTIPEGEVAIYRSGCSDWELVQTAVHSAAPPPPCLLRAMSVTLTGR